MKLSELKLNPNNPRFIKDNRFKDLVRSIKGFPEGLEYNRIKIDENNIIIAGNMRYRALKELGYTEIPDEWIVRVRLKEKKRDQFIIVDNVSFGEHDYEILANEYEMGDLIEWGLTPEEFNITQLEPEAVEDNYVIPDTIETDIVRGDIFEIGNHRLMCGDSTMIDDVDKLMNGEKANMVFTDPPYGMFLDTDYSKMNGIGKKYSRVIGDNEDFSAELINTIFSCFGYCDEMFIFGADYFAELLQDKNNGSWIVWDKYPTDNNDKRFGSSFELCWSKSKHKRIICREKSINVNHETVKEKENHPTQKPIRLCSWFLNKWGLNSDLIVDLYLGSGSTMVAAHQLNRKCYGMELDPKYCQVIIDRMLKLDPTLEVKRNGEPYKASGR